MNLTDLQNKGWLAGDSVDEALYLLGDDDQDDSAKAPWIARFAQGFGAWLAGLFLTGFLAVALQSVGSSEYVLTAVGLFVIAGSLFLIRSVKVIFLKQLALAWNIAGYIALLIGVNELLGWDLLGSLCVVILLCPLVYWFSKNAVQRFLSVAWIWGTWLIHAMDDGGSWFLLGGIIASLAIVASGLSGVKSGPFWVPAVTASIVGLLAQIWFMLIDLDWPFDEMSGQILIPAGIAIALTFTGLLWFLTRPVDRTELGWLIGFGVVLLALAFAGAVGVVASLGLLAVAHARNNRWLGWLAVIALGAFLIHFYYHIGTTLMTKSLWMMGVGTVMLVLRFAFLREKSEPQIEA